MNDVDPLVIGGFAVAAHGHPRGTQDLDIAARQDPDNLGRLAAALTDLDAELRGIGDLKHDLSPLDPDHLALGGNWTLTTRGGHLDVRGDPTGAASYPELRSRAIAVDVEGRTLHVVGLDDLVAMKLAAGRPKDLQDVTVIARQHPELGLDPEASSSILNGPSPRPPIRSPTGPHRTRRSRRPSVIGAAGGHAGTAVADARRGACPTTGDDASRRLRPALKRFGCCSPRAPPTSRWRSP